MTTLIAPDRSSWLTKAQCYWVIAQLVALISLVAAMVIARPDYTALLWNTDTGVKMSLAAVVGLIANFAGFAGLCAFLNRKSTPVGVRRGVSIVVAFLLTVFFYVPALAVIWVGPAAIQIQKQLANG